MKILLLHQNRFGRPWGGIENYCNQLQDLFKDDKDISIELSPLYPHYTRFGKLKYDPIDLRAAIINSKADIIQVNGYTSFAVRQGIQLAYELGKKVVLSPHWHPFKRMNSPILAKLFWLNYIKPQLGKLNGILCINNEDSNFFSQYSIPVSTIPHWINNKTFIGDNLYPKEENNILFVGRSDDKNKGFDHLLKLPENKYRIHCVGAPVETSRSDIVFHTQISQAALTSLYKTASLVVVPSRYEAFSYVALEALCAGCPIVASSGVRFCDYVSDPKIIGTFNFHDYKKFSDLVSEYMGRRFDPHEYISPFQRDYVKNCYKKFYKSIANDR